MDLSHVQIYILSDVVLFQDLFYTNEDALRALLVSAPRKTLALEIRNRLTVGIDTVEY